MAVLNDLDRLPHLGGATAHVKQAMPDKLTEHRRDITTHGEDMPEILDWKWRPGR